MLPIDKAGSGSEILSALVLFHSRPAPVISAAKTLQAHLANILTYFQPRVTNATAEGLNSKIQMVKEMACGFRNREHYRTASYFHCGGLDLYPRLQPSA